MGVINSKLQEFHTADSKSATTQVGKKEEKSKLKGKVAKKHVALKRFDQAFVKKPLPTRAQTPLVKVKKLKKPQRLGLYHRLNQKLNQNVQDELDQSEDSSTSSTTSDDLDSQ